MLCFLILSAQRIALRSSYPACDSLGECNDEDLDSL